MDLKQTKIAALVAEHGLPGEILAQIVDDNGLVDSARLGIALQTRAFTQSGMNAVNEGLIEALCDAYWEAQDRRDAVAMISLKGRIYKLGGQLGPRRKI